MKPILSVRDFASRLGVPSHKLYSIAENAPAHYRYWAKWNADKTKSRHMRVPDDALMEIQRRIHARILIPAGTSDIAFGGVRGSSPRKNAGRHLGQPWVVTLDIKDFFGSVGHRAVYKMLRNHLGLGRDVASLMTKLTTLRDELPQGAPTSLALANLILAQPVDGPLQQAAKARNVTVSRFVDDFCLSGREPQSLINFAARLLSGCQLSVHRKRVKYSPESKLKIRSRSKPQEVTGLLVNSPARPTLSRRKRDAVRAAIFQLNQPRDTVDRQQAINSISGRIAHISQFHPGSGRRLRHQLVQRERMSRVVSARQD